MLSALADKELVRRSNGRRIARMWGLEDTLSRRRQLGLDD